MECWRFETARFVIIGEAHPEDMAWDGEGEGPSESDAWFRAVVRVSLVEDEEDTLGEAHLGGCWYKRESDFFRVESWATIERDAWREIRRTMEHTRYLIRHRKAYRGQIARQLTEVAEQRRLIVDARENARRGVVVCAYFADMVREAIAYARREIARRGDLARTLRAA